MVVFCSEELNAKILSTTQVKSEEQTNPSTASSKESLHQSSFYLHSLLLQLLHFLLFLVILHLSHGICISLVGFLQLILHSVMALLAIPVYFNEDKNLIFDSLIKRSVVCNSP